LSIRVYSFVVLIASFFGLGVIAYVVYIHGVVTEDSFSFRDDLDIIGQPI